VQEWKENLRLRRGDSRGFDFFLFSLGGADQGQKQGSKSCVLGYTQEQVVVEEEEEEKNDGCDLGSMADDGEIDGCWWAFCFSYVVVDVNFF
jgi:hypothetical protein